MIAPTPQQLRACAAWNEEQAANAYNEDDAKTYERLTLQANRLWEQSRKMAGVKKTRAGS